VDEKEQLDHTLLSNFANDRMLDSGITCIDDDVADDDAVWAKIDLTSPPP
jgi:hypothetical protein